MYATALPLLPPPSSSLLPPLHTSANDQLHALQSHQHPHQRRPKHVGQTRSALSLLSLDERTITQRKLAIAMYGYSWLKPAGCTKTMLGRREEELEREEVERQLREVEMQERVAMEGEEAERQATLRQQGEQLETGEGMLDGERDLDEDIPEAEDPEADEDVEEDLDDAEEDMDGDLDDEIPDADVGESSWVYDTNRDPDTESEEGTPGENQILSSSGHRQAMFIGGEDAVAAEVIANAMLDQDELGELDPQHDLDDDLPDMDAEMDVDENEGEYDLDDDVPEAEDEGEWQHTDTELEESEMDISMLPSQTQMVHSPPSAHSSRHHRSSLDSENVGPGTTHEELRRTSGNMMMPPPTIPSASSQRSRRQQSQQGSGTGPERRQITPQTHLLYHTPVINTNDSISALISTGEPSFLESNSRHPPTRSLMDQDTEEQIEDSLNPQRNRRNWALPANARRNLFGGFTRPDTSTTGLGMARTGAVAPSNPAQLAASTGSGFTPDPPRRPQPPAPGPHQNTSAHAHEAPDASMISRRRQPHHRAQTQDEQTVLASTSNPRTSNPDPTTTTTAATAISSGGLFTPPVRINPSRARAHFDAHPAPGDGEDGETQADNESVPRSRTRSGRLLGSIQIGGRRGRRA